MPRISIEIVFHKTSEELPVVPEAFQNCLMELLVAYKDGDVGMLKYYPADGKFYYEWSEVDPPEYWAYLPDDIIPNNLKEKGDE